MASAVQAQEMELPTGGDFLHRTLGSTAVFTPEQFSDEHQQFYATARDFIVNEVLPRVEEIEHKKPGVTIDLMRQAAELGLFMVGIPEQYEGLGLDKVSLMRIAEALSPVGSFAVTYSAHSGIGTLPLVYYGTHEQKQKYLPKLASGEMLGAYCLSESGSGSDALAAKTTAQLTSDGEHYILNGTKAWITNGNVADLYTVFAQVDGDKFTAFLVERKTEGLSVGKEERKLGIRGSSTTQIILDDVKVPVENVLGDIGRGHKIAFNILNIGRWKLGVGAMGGAKYVLGEGVQYAKERRQFKKPIASFGLIRQKIAESAALIYAGETMAYRTAGCIDLRTSLLEKDAEDYSQQAIKIIEDFTVEASVVKVYCSEALGWIADQMLQIHGGNGYTEDYAVERVYRDARINRIFEGTNEINRLIIPATFLKRSLQGRLPLMDFMGRIIQELGEPATLPQKGSGPLANERHAAEMVRRAAVYAASYAGQKYLSDLKDKQCLLGALADVVIDLFGMDSVVSRAEQAVESMGSKRAEIHLALCSMYCFEARANAFQKLRRIAMMMADGDELDTLYENLGKLDQRYRVDYTGLQELVAERVLEAGGYTTE